jgi:hypothetical protein
MRTFDEWLMDRKEVMDWLYEVDPALHEAVVNQGQRIVPALLMAAGSLWGGNKLLNKSDTPIPANDPPPIVSQVDEPPAPTPAPAAKPAPDLTLAQAVKPAAHLPRPTFKVDGNSWIATGSAPLSKSLDDYTSLQVARQKATMAAKVVAAQGLFGTDVGSVGDTTSDIVRGNLPPHNVEDEQVEDGILTVTIRGQMPKERR